MTSKKKIRYFIHYSWLIDGIKHGVGRCEVLRKKPVVNIKDIEGIEQAITETGTLPVGAKAMIINWRRFEEPES